MEFKLDLASTTLTKPRKNSLMTINANYATKLMTIRD